MCNLCPLALIMCCAVFGVVTAYPQNAQGNNVPAQQSKVARAASPAADSRYYRPGFGGTGFGRPGFGGAGPGGSGFGRPGFTGSGFGEPGFGGSGFGRPGYWQPSGSFSNANANSFNTAFQTPFGGFSLSSSNSFGGSTNYGRK